MDIQMPVMDGFVATKTLKADVATKEIPILALTSFAMSGNEQRILEAGCDGYISKPIDTSGFMKKVEEYLSWWILYHATDSLMITPERDV